MRSTIILKRRFYILKYTLWLLSFLCFFILAKWAHEWQQVEQKKKEYLKVMDNSRAAQEIKLNRLNYLSDLKARGAVFDASIRHEHGMMKEDEVFFQYSDE